MPEVKDLVRQARFIFKGTIQKLNAATMSVVPVTDSTAIVKVEQVFQAPETLGDYTDQDITVQLGDPKGAKEGQQAVFFANSWLYGESIAVVEVGRVAPEDLTQLRQQIADANRSIADEELQSRVAGAELVVVGKVLKTNPAPEELRRGPITEHDPDWWEAIIEVESVEKGELPEGPVIVLFPNSTDEMWIDSPKFEVGQEGLWILQKDQQEKAWPIMRIPGRTALHPLDFQRKDQRERITALIQGYQ